MPEKITGTLLKRAPVGRTFISLLKDFCAPFCGNAFHIPIRSSLDVYNFLWKYTLEDRQRSHCARLVDTIAILDRKQCKPFIGLL